MTADVGKFPVDIPKFYAKIIPIIKSCVRQEPACGVGKCEDGVRGFRGRLLFSLREGESPAESSPVFRRQLTFTPEQRR